MANRRYNVDLSRTIKTYSQFRAKSTTDDQKRFQKVYPHYRPQPVYR